MNMWTNATTIRHTQYTPSWTVRYRVCSTEKKIYALCVPHTTNITDRYHVKPRSLMTWFADRYVEWLLLLVKLRWVSSCCYSHVAVGLVFVELVAVANVINVDALFKFHLMRHMWVASEGTNRSASDQARMTELMRRRWRRIRLEYTTF